MKKLLSLLLAAGAFSFLSVTPAPAAPVGKLAGFAGNFRGTLDYGGIAKGSATAKVSAQRPGTRGVFVLTSKLVTGTDTYTLTETFRVNRGKFTYRYHIVGVGPGTTDGTGAGSVLAEENFLQMKGTATIGGTSYTMVAILARSGRRLLAVNALSGSGGASFVYSLTRR